MEYSPLTSEQKRLHPWKCDLSRGDTQCKFVIPHSDGYLCCCWREGHPDTLPHVTGYDDLPNALNPQDRWFVRQSEADEAPAPPSSVGRYDLLLDLQAWMKHQLVAHIEHRSRGKGGHDGDGSSWTVVAIPEWFVRQKLSAIEATLNVPLTEVVELELEVRRLMWLGHGHTGMYGDDGEMQCSECMRLGCWDYKRAPLSEVRAVYNAAILERAAKAQANAS